MWDCQAWELEACGDMQVLRSLIFLGRCQNVQGDPCKQGIAHQDQPQKNGWIRADSSSQKSQ